MSDNPVSPAAPPAPQSASLKEGILGLFSIYIDPAGVARRVQLKWFWVYPLIVVSIVNIIIQLQLAPYGRQLRVNVPNAPPPQTPTMVGQIVSACGSMLFLIAIVAFVSLLVMALGAMVDARARYKHIFSLGLTGGMISILQQIATLFLVRANAEDIHTMRDLTQQPLGLDIFIHTGGVLGSVLSFFSIFQVWLIVMMALSYSKLARVSKGKAFFATCPGWVIGLIFYIIIGIISDKFFA